LLTALALALALGVTVGLRSGPVAGAFCACLFLTVVLSAADPRFGLLAVLSVAPFDGLLREQLSCAYLWYPDALHVMDPIAAALLLGWFARWALGRVEVKWRWYDWLAAAFLAVSMIAALRGFLAGHERALAASRFIPAMAVYLPAREVLADPAGRRKFLRWLVWYGILYSIGVLVLAFALRDTYGRGHDVLLPRICRLSDPRILLLALFVVWAGLSRQQFTRRGTASLLLAGLLIGGLLGINNTRTLLAGALLSWGLLCALLWRVKCDRRTWLRVGLGGLGVFLLGVGGVHIASAVANRASYMRQLRQQAGATPLSVPRVNLQTMITSMRLTGEGAAVHESTANRVREWKGVLHGISLASAVVGHGLGAPVVYTKMKGKRKEVHFSGHFVHNGYLFLLHATGLLGLVVCCAWLIGLLVAAWHALPNSATTGLPLLHSGAILFLSAMLATALTIGNFALPPAAALTVTSAALVASLATSVPRARR